MQIIENLQKIHKSGINPKKLLTIKHRHFSLEFKMLLTPLYLLAQDLSQKVTDTICLHRSIIFCDKHSLQFKRETKSARLAMEFRKYWIFRICCTSMHYCLPYSGTLRSPQDYIAWRDVSLPSLVWSTCILTSCCHIHAVHLRVYIISQRHHCFGGGTHQQT